MHKSFANENIFLYMLETLWNRVKGNIKLLFYVKMSRL